MNIFADTHTIAFELSNTCQLACFHKGCPASLTMASPYRMKKVIHMPARIVYDSLVELGEYGYDGVINFHQYNEPLIDPRLFDFIRAANRDCPKARVVLISNGLNLSVQLAIELKEAGCTGLWVTRYGDEEDRDITRAYVQETIAPIFGDAWCNILPWERLDNRMQIYDAEISDLVDRCFAPICTIPISCQGDVTLCCYDWGRSVTFGNLNDMSLIEIMSTGKMQEAYRQLQAGNRRFDVCRRCRFMVTP